MGETAQSSLTDHESGLLSSALLLTRLRLTQLLLCAPLGQKTPIFTDQSANIGLFFPCEPGFAVTRSYPAARIIAPTEQSGNISSRLVLSDCAGG